MFRIVSYNKIPFTSLQDIILALVLLLSTLYTTIITSQAQTINFELTRNLNVKIDEAKYKKCNTAKYSLYMGKKAKQTILLMNLVRLYPKYFKENILTPYVKHTHQDRNKYLTTLEEELEQNKSTGLLRPSVGLYLASFSHAFISGITAYAGHRALTFRLRIFLNFNRTYGENCEYGRTHAGDIMLALLIDEGIASLGHRKNILKNKYKRVGVSKQLHFKYRRNTVMDFSGPKLNDRILGN